MKKTKLLLIIGIGLLVQSVIFSHPQIMSYQGKLTDSFGNAVVDSSYSAEFLFYTDSVEGLIVWAESNNIHTIGGLFSYNIGSANNLSSEIFSDNELLYLEVRVDGNPILPRSMISSAGYAFSAGNLNMTDNGKKVIETNQTDKSLILYDSLEQAYITLQDKPFDSAVVLPESSINADEILNEPGLTLSLDINLKTLSTGEMVDLNDVTITIPEDGYIVLYGKCYLLLSGTTGANTAIIQIDETEGGSTHFPYYTIAGLSGYVNSGTNYFPIMVTRLFYKQKGTYTFRLEGKANHPLPAVAQSWDHVLSAYYYPTSYHGVEAIVSNPFGFDHFRKLEATDRGNDEPNEIYKVDLRELELKNK